MQTLPSGGPSMLGGAGVGQEAGSSPAVGDALEQDSGVQGAVAQEDVARTSDEQTAGQEARSHSPAL